MVCVAAVALSGGCNGRDVTTRSGGVVASEIPYERINLADPGFVEPDPDEMVLQVACRNYPDYLDDISLNRQVVILDDPGLLRSAELLHGDFSGRDVPLLAEQAVLDYEGDQEAALAQLQSDPDLDERDIEEATRYLDARALPPTEGAAASYVVYAVNVTLSRARIVRLPLGNPVTRVDHSGTGSSLRTQLPSGRVVAISESACMTDE